MDQGILKGHLLSLKTTKGTEKLDPKPQYITLFKHYILCFKAAETPFDCAVFNTESGKITETATGLSLGKKSGYSLCYWKDDTYVLFGGLVRQSRPKQKPLMEKALDVQFLQVIEENSNISFRATKCGVIDEEFWIKEHTAQVYKDNLYIIGGAKNFPWGSPLLQVWKFDLNEKTWRNCEVQGEAPGPRVNLSSALFGNKIYLFGGQVPNLSTYQPVKDLFALDVENMTWEKIRGDSVLQNSLTQLNEKLQVEKIGQKIYISGQLFAEFTIFDPINNVLEQSQGVAPKDGFKIRSHENRTMLFRFLETNPFKEERVAIVEFQYLEIEGKDQAKDEEKKEEETQSILSGKPRKHILSQSNHMEILWNEKSFSDVIFVVQGEEIKAHRNILIKCHYFQSMFNSGMMEANAEKIQVPEISSANFKAILEYIYFGKIALTEQLAMDLVIIADMYCMAELKEDCETYLSKNMKAENLLALIKTAETADSEKLENKIINFLMANIDKLKDTMDVDSIPHSLLIKCMVNMNLSLKGKN